MYLVCDGGGTKTEYLLFDKTGRVHGRSKTTGSNALFTDPVVAAEAVCFGIRDCLNQAAVTAEGLSGIALFIPGFREALDLVKAQYPQVEISLFGDEYNAYYGALGEPGGIAVLAGTGSFAVGRTRTGEWFKAGGWGPLFDDKGSGYHIGIMCLERITHLYDLGVDDSVLQNCALKHLNLADVAQIRRAAYQADFTRAHVASLSYAVASAAKLADEDALQILDQAAAALVDLASTVTRYFEQSEVPVSLIGGLTGMGDLLTGRFQQILQERLPTCKYCEPYFKPIVGAALYVMYEFEHETSMNPMFVQNLMRGLEE